VYDCVDYTLSHFAFEESLQEEAGYAYCKPHKKVHELFARKVSEYQERMDLGDDVAEELHATLPQHVVLAKVNLLRFCQSADARDARTWYDRLQSLNVSLLVCTPNGVVISAIDLESPSTSSRSTGRSQKLKEATLEACRVRYLRCRPGQWPQGALMAAWALGQDVAAPQHERHGDEFNDAGDQLARKLKERRAERAALWAESSFAQDSFFAFDSRFDGVTGSAPAPLDELRPSRSAATS